MKKALLAITIGSCFIIACSNSNDSKGTVSNVSSDASLQNTVISASDTSTPVQSTDSTSVLTAPGPTNSPGLTPSVPAQPTTLTASGMNPPHGEPGHRCDIAVGAPLNSPPGAKVPPPNPGPNVSTPSISPAPGNTSASPTNTAPGMNPPHGEPGHDCAIPVGAPLKK